MAYVLDCAVLCWTMLGTLHPLIYYSSIVVDVQGPRKEVHVAADLNKLRDYLSTID